MRVEQLVAEFSPWVSSFHAQAHWHEGVLPCVYRMMSNVIRFSSVDCCGKPPQLVARERTVARYKVLGCPWKDFLTISLTKV
jgi:hypothetical protein